MMKRRNRWLLDMTENQHCCIYSWAWILSMIWVFCVLILLIVFIYCASSHWFKFLIILNFYNQKTSKFLCFYCSTSGGVIRHEDGRTVTAPTIMWVEVSSYIAAHILKLLLKKYIQLYMTQLLYTIIIISFFILKGSWYPIEQVEIFKFSFWESGRNILKWTAAWVCILA